MVNHSSATAREETPHVNKSTKNKALNLVNRSTRNKTLKLNGTSEAEQEAAAGGRSRRTASKVIRRRNSTARTTISNALSRRAQAVINDRSIDAQTRALIRYGLEVNDPLLAELVRCIEAGETIIETIVLLKHLKLTPRSVVGKMKR